jgi:hypothetical protein
MPSSIASRPMYSPLRAWLRKRWQPLMMKWPAVVRTRKFGGVLAEVTVGESRLGIYFSNWSGLETYSLEGREVLRVRSLALTGERRIPLGDGRVAEVEVRFFPRWSARLLVDGRIVVTNLFPHLLFWQIAMVASVSVGVLLSLLLSIFVLRAR